MKLRYFIFFKLCSPHIIMGGGCKSGELGNQVFGVMSSQKLKYNFCLCFWNAFIVEICWYLVGENSKKEGKCCLHSAKILSEMVTTSVQCCHKDPEYCSGLVSKTKADPTDFCCNCNSGTILMQRYARWFWISLNNFFFFFILVFEWSLSKIKCLVTFIKFWDNYLYLKESR